MTDLECNLIKSNIALLVHNVTMLHKYLYMFDYHNNDWSRDLWGEYVATHTELAASDWHRIEKLLDGEK